MSNVVTKDARMELKTTSALKQMLGSAAALVGQDLSLRVKPGLRSTG